jgi:hypothetical protein
MKANQTAPSDNLKKRPYITRHTSQEDHGHHDAKEYDNDERVDQTEPMYTRVEDMEIIVPARCLKEELNKVVSKMQGLGFAHPRRIRLLWMNRISIKIERR